MKTCLYELNTKLEMIAQAEKDYPLRVLPNGGVEQDPADWWNAMAVTTRNVIENAKISPNQIAGLSFCSQMQGLVLMDLEGKPIRPAMSYMDQRAGEQLKKGLAYGPQIAGCNIIKLIKSLYITKAVPASVKDPVWKYKWVHQNEPELFAKVYQWLDVKEFLIHQCTGIFIMTKDSAFATLLYDTRKNRNCFSKSMCKMFGVKYEHMPKIIASSEKAGELTKEASDFLGLCEGTSVFGGGGDASLIGIGAGAIKNGSTHIYCGTSGWVSTVVERPMVDTGTMIAAVVGANPGYYNYFAELETAGKCLEWVKEHLALDEIGIYLERKKVSDSYEAIYRSLYDYMMHVIKDIPPGSNGVIFTPWLHGNRCPFEDPYVKGMFFNIGLDTGKTELIRSVLEGVCYHMRWMLEAQERKIKVSDVIRFVGGGALSSLTCQILADVLGKTVETVSKPQNAGAMGAAIVAAVGLGYIENLEKASDLLPISHTYLPNPKNKLVYDKGYEVFRKLYPTNKHNFWSINRLKVR
jgi:xylulokinase